MKNYKLPLILGGCALIAIIATLITIGGGFSSDYGLYITSVQGKVSVTDEDVNAATASDKPIPAGSVITVGEDSHCTLAYKGNKNSENNFIVVGANSQILVSNEFDGKNDGELYLRRGTVIGNFMEEDISSVNVRTADAMITMGGSVAKASYYTNEFMSYTDIYTIMGQNDIQLYDAAGSPVNKSEPQIMPRCGRIVSDEGPAFEWLNVIFDLRELSAFDLNQLIKISAIVGEEFPFNTEELKSVYDEKNGSPDVNGTEPVPDVTTEPPVTTVTENTSEPENTASPNTETTLPGQTTVRVITRPPQTTASQQQNETTTTAVPDDTGSGGSDTDDPDYPDDPDNTDDDPESSESSGSRDYHTVIIYINGEENIQEVAHGDSAIKPDDPDIDGLTFIGWDGSFDNITEDTVITALFSEINNVDDPLATVHTVTVVINGKTSTISVEHGQSANLPDNVIVEGFTFRGWDKDFSRITSDITITAILEPDNQPHIVTFVIDGNNYTVQVEHGGTAVPPYIPRDDTGFIGWDKQLGNITADTTITAVYKITASHTVTFMIDGLAYPVTVADGETATPPFTPAFDSEGRAFAGWSPRDLTNIKRDTVVTAIFYDP